MDDGDARLVRSTFSGGLRFRIAALLSLALLPIGVLSFTQTQTLSAEISERANQTLLALTERSASNERRAIERAIGAAEAISSSLSLIRGDPEVCFDYLTDFLARSGRYSFIGFIPEDGIMRCSSTTQVFDFSDEAIIAAGADGARIHVDRIERPMVSEQVVLNVLYPVSEDDRFLGYISVSLPSATVLELSDVDAADRPRSLTIFNFVGDILSTKTNSPDRDTSLPSNVDLSWFTGSGATTFTADNQFGERQTFAVVPIVPNLVYALGAWSPDRNRTTIAPVTLLPLLMWVASLFVAYVAVERLVIRHITRVSAEMRRFADTRKVPSAPVLQAGLSTEIRALESTFGDMAHTILEDEARMENTMREKNVLLKEVHHRVKNNLQTMSSIINMQMRRAANPETERVLQRLQDRVLGLATVHRNLYQAANLDQTDAGALLAELLGQLAGSGMPPVSQVRLDTRFDPIIMIPDQAVPLSLLLSELVTNAIKHVGAPAGQVAWIEIHFIRLEGGQAQLTVGNSLNPAHDDPADGNGLGQQLINAFAIQLHATHDHDRTPESYCVTVTFAVSDFTSEPPDH